MKGIDPITGWLKTIDGAHHEVHEGSYYEVTYSVASIGALTTTDDTQQITWTTPNSTKLMNLVVNAYCGATALFLFTEAPTGGDATPTGTLVGYNKNRSYPDSPITISYDGTEVSGGTVLEREYLSGGKFGAGENRASQEWILKPNTKYAVSLYLNAAQPSTLSLGWYMKS
jgi:hypothetical protein